MTGIGLEASGSALIRVVFVVAIGFLVWKFLPSWTTTNPPDKQTPESIAVDGPTHLRAGHTYTFFLTLTYPRPLHATSSYRVDAEVAEDGLGEPLLDSRVRIGIKHGSRSGRASFALSCEADGRGGFVLRGSDGSSTSGTNWRLLARIPKQRNSSAYQGSAALAVTCAER